MSYRTSHMPQTASQEPPTPVIDMQAARAELCTRKFSFFVKEFWSEIIPEELEWNWHMDVLCEELQKVADRVFLRLPKEYDLLINIPPGTTKSTIATVMFPAWCWTRDASLRFITGSYSHSLSQGHAELSRDIIKSEKYQQYFDIYLRHDKDAKSDYMNTKRGSRFSTSVGGTVTGKHGHILIIDDPLNPKEAASPTTLKGCNEWMGKTLATRKVDKKLTPTILIMQRLHQDDPSGVLIRKSKDGSKQIRHICLPGSCAPSDDGEGNRIETLVSPPELREKYVDGLLDPKRMSQPTLLEMMSDLGQYGYAGQVQQSPSPATGGMFRPDKMPIYDKLPCAIIRTLIYWDKAGTHEGGAYTAGVKLAELQFGGWAILDVVRGQWRSDVRELKIQNQADTDGRSVEIGMEQEPGSGGKESAESSAKHLAGYTLHIDRPTGDKIWRADPLSVQVNMGNIALLRGNWNADYIEELRLFPNSTYKDQVDATSGAFNLMTGKRKAGVW